MPSLQRGTSRTGRVYKGKTWRARVRFEGVSHYLGSYRSREEAEKVEEHFRELMRSG